MTVQPSAIHPTLLLRPRARGLVSSRLMGEAALGDLDQALDDFGACDLSLLVAGENRLDLLAEDLGLSLVVRVLLLISPLSSFSSSRIWTLGCSVLAASESRSSRVRSLLLTAGRAGRRGATEPPRFSRLKIVCGSLGTDPGGGTLVGLAGGGGVCGAGADISKSLPPRSRSDGHLGTRPNPRTASDPDGRRARQPPAARASVDRRACGHDMLAWCLCGLHSRQPARVLFGPLRLWLTMQTNGCTNTARATRLRLDRLLGQPERGSLGVSADRPVIPRMDDASTERLDPVQRLADVAHGEVGQRKESPGPRPRSCTPTVGRSERVCHPSPSPGSRACSSTPRSPAQKRRARAGSSAGNSIRDSEEPTAPILQLRRCRAADRRWASRAFGACRHSLHDGNRPAKCTRPRSSSSASSSAESGSARSFSRLTAASTVDIF